VAAQFLHQDRGDGDTAVSVRGVAGEGRALAAVFAADEVRVPGADRTYWGCSRQVSQGRRSPHWYCLR